jgi:REP element-mobilizing transposase RayT
MTSPRQQIVATDAPGFYHCVSRCVRRAFLCGTDAYTGRCFEHRKAWVEERLLALAECFAIGVYAYAVMSNHVHVVAYVDPSVAWAWSPQEVARRWMRLFPVRLNGDVDEESTRQRADALAGNAERIAICRERLASLSWFMRCLSEPIARRANREDACTGRFWEGRFRCQALLDDAVLVACMAYVDLNPIRAGMATSVEACEHTSVRWRIERFDPTPTDAPLKPLAGPATSELPLNLRDYLVLVDLTGRIARQDKRGAIDPTAAPILRRLGVESAEWTGQVFHIETRYWRAVGAVDALLAKARELGQCWLKGAGRGRRRRRSERLPS